jgi:hypothetical protein
MSLYHDVEGGRGLFSAHSGELIPNGTKIECQFDGFRISDTEESR